MERNSTINHAPISFSGPPRKLLDAKDGVMTSTAHVTRQSLSGIPSNCHILRGQFVDVLRSNKGKLKGLQLRSGDQDYQIKLAKYLRPMLVRELTLGMGVQVWAHFDGEVWRGFNVIPLAEAQPALSHQPQPFVSPQLVKAAAVRIKVCGKGKCFKRGSKSLLKLLQSEVEANPNLQHVSIETSGCMKACKHGPNLQVLPHKKCLNQVDEATALSLLSEYQ